MHFFLPALGKDSGVRNLLNTRPDLEGVEKAAVFSRVDIIILFFGVTNRGRNFLCFVLFKERLDFFLIGIGFFCRRGCKSGTVVVTRVKQRRCYYSLKWKHRSMN